METHKEEIKPIVLDASIYDHENEWVALDAARQVIAHAERLPELLKRLTPEQEAQRPTFMQVLPRNVVFAGPAL
jgi:hypothetical protein